MEKAKKNEALEWLKAIVVAVAIALFVRGFLFETIEVRQYSMYPTFDQGDRVIIGKIYYRLNVPEYGQIIVFQKADMQFPYIKRVIGTSGDTVEIKDGQLLINDSAVNEPYIYEAMLFDYPQVTVPPDMMFVMGDNRNTSKDSRFVEVGFVPVNSIRGIVRLKIWPFSGMKWFQLEQVNG